MARPSTAPQRNLTLTEELEKLEQSITLTLQEIDHNFSRAHRIVTTSILPVVEKYAEHSQNVWESSKFWKQFFEASANVSLSGYEEPPENDDTVTEDATIASPSASTYGSPSQIQSGINPSTTPQPSDYQRPIDNSSFSATPATPQITPRPKSKQPRPSIAAYSSPYEALKREIKGQPPSANDSSTLPSTPRNNSQHQEDDDSSPSSSIFLPPSTAQKAPHRTPKDNPLLHRVLDRTWRIQATPHTSTKAPHQNLPYRDGRTPVRNNNASTPSATAKKIGEHDDLDSSPALAAPELDSEIFGTPAHRGRIPGVSVLTPAGKGNGRGINNRTPGIRNRKGRGGPQTPGADGEEEDEEPKKGRAVWDSDSDDDEEGLVAGMSPPKTMQFHVPQTRLLRTPAREASKRIVEDLLLTAGGNVTDEFSEEPDSPSVVRRGALEDDDTF